MIKKLNYIISALLVTLGIIIGSMGFIIGIKFLGNKTIESTEALIIDDENYKIFLEIMKIVENKAYFFNQQEDLFEGALRGIIEALGDPYSVYFSEKEYVDYINQINASIYGIGITIAHNGPYPIIIKVYENTPAYNAGVEVGDIIKTVNYIDVKDKPLSEISNIIKSSEEEVKIGIYRDNPNNQKHYVMKLDEINLPTISYQHEKIGSNLLGYLKIDSFSLDTANELFAAMNVLEELKIDYLIIDVRDNPGGYLSSVTDVLDYFLNSKQPFMYQEAKDGSLEARYLEKFEQEIDYDIVVLINENSASAAEVFASAMNELGNYDLIGVKTFGKGTIQQFFCTSESLNCMKLTTKIWLTPSKKWIDKEGVNPTIIVEDELRKMLFINPFKEMKFDIVDENVKCVQVLLTKLGYDIRTDGYFDKATEAAVKDFQLTNDLQITGVVDFITAYHLNKFYLNILNDLDYDNQYQVAKAYFIN